MRCIGQIVGKRRHERGERSQTSVRRRLPASHGTDRETPLSALSRESFSPAHEFKARARQCLLYLSLGIGLCLSPSATHANANASPEAIANVRSIIGEWTGVENAISREAIEWEGEKVLLNDLIAVASARAKRLEAELAETRDLVSTADAEREELLARSDTIAAQADQIRRFVTEIEQNLQSLNPRLPDPLREELAPLYQRIPGNPDQTSRGIGERMQTVVSLLSQIAEFNGKITVGERIQTLPDGTGKGVFRTLWIGLAQAYYLAPGDAGIGIAEPDGWSWHSRPELAARIQEAIALTEGSGSEPRFLELPVQMKQETAP